MRLRAKLAAALGASVLFFCHAAGAAKPCVAAADSAQDLRASGKLREARASLLVCSQKTCNSVVRADCERWLKEVDEQTPSLIVRAVDARGRDVLGARVTIDDTGIELDGSPVQVDPGQHVVRARARSGDLAEQKTLVALAEKARVIEIRFDRPLEQDGTRLAEPGSKLHAPARAEPPVSESKGATEASRPSHVLPIALAAVGVVALGAFGYFEIAGHSAYSDLENGCFKTAAKCTPAQTEPVRQQFIGAAVSLGVSVVALGAAAVVYFMRKPSSTSAFVDLQRQALTF